MNFQVKGNIFGRLLGMVAGGILLVSAHAADNTPAVPVPRDVLVYKDGDRVQGKLIKKEDGFFIFHSDRFGDLRVPETDAVFVPAEKAIGAVATAPAPAPAMKASTPDVPANAGGKSEAAGTGVALGNVLPLGADGQGAEFLRAVAWQVRVFR